MAEVEKSITLCESQMEQIQQQMCLPEVLSDFQKLSPLQQQEAKLSQNLENFLALWETLASQLNEKEE